MASPELVHEIDAFIAEYRDAFDSAVVDRISPLYHAPCITIRGDGSVHVLQSKGDIEDFFGKVTASCIQDGGKRGRFFDLEVVPIGSRSVLATVTWELLKADDSVLRSWRHSYNLLRTGDTWQILASTFHLK